MDKTIAILTDFGLEDIYVGVMKGVMCGIAPGANQIDITHMVEPQNVRQAAFLLLNAWKYFPKGTVFLVVVDPGVGSTRRPIIVDAGDYTFIAPDNGVLSYVLAHIDAYTAYEITNSAYRLEAVSTTFHGRDIFAPCAAHVATGVRPEQMGRRLDDIKRLPLPFIEIGDNCIEGEVMHTDRFGNVITSIGHLRHGTGGRLVFDSVFVADLQQVPVVADSARINIGGQLIHGISASYSESMRGDLLAVIESSGFLEVAVNQGSAANRLDVVVGDRVQLEIGDVDAAIRD